MAIILVQAPADFAGRGIQIRRNYGRLLDSTLVWPPKLLLPGILATGLASAAIIAVAPPAAESDFATRASQPGVILATNFPTESAVTAHLWGDARNDWDQAVYTSGGGSLRYDILNTSGATSNNDWRINFGQTVGATGAGQAVPSPKPVINGDGRAGDLGNTVYIQWRQRFSSEMLNTMWLLENAALSTGNTLQSATSTTAVMASSETFADSALVGDFIEILSGTGVGQVRMISANTAANDTATVNVAWTTTPDATSSYRVIQRSSAGVGGWKQIIFNYGDEIGWYHNHPTISEANSSTAQEIVIQNVANRGLPVGYHQADNSFDRLAPPIDTAGSSYVDGTRDFSGNVSDSIWQNALDNGNANPLLAHPTQFGLRIANNTETCGSGSFGCTGEANQMLYDTQWVPSSVNAVTYHPNEWMTFQLGLTLGTYNPVGGTGGYATWDDSRVEIWVGREGQRSLKIVDFTRDLYVTNEEGYSKIWMTPFHTDLQVDPDRLATIQSWIDEIIVSTDKINDPDTGQRPKETAAWASSMAANTWFYLTAANGFSGNLTAVSVADTDPGGTASGSFTPSLAFLPWTGASFDPVLFRWVSLTPGGHNDHPGNEVWAFERMNSPNPNWRLLEPSSVYRNNLPTYADGTPSAQHTYDLQVFHEGLRKHFQVGLGSVTGDGLAYPNVFAYDADTDSWDQTGGTVVGVYDSIPGSLDGSQMVGSAACYDATDNLIWWHSSNNGGVLGRFDPTQPLGSQWTSYGAPTTGIYIQFQLVCNPQDGYVLTIGGGTAGEQQAMHFYDTDAPASGATIITNLVDGSGGSFTDTDMFETTGGVVQMGVGATYHPPSNTFFILDAGGDIWQLTPPAGLNKASPNASAWTFDRVTQSGTPPVGYDGNGWYSRFQWVPLDQLAEGGIFMVVGRTTTNVAVFKVQ